MASSPTPTSCFVLARAKARFRRAFLSARCPPPPSLPRTASWSWTPRYTCWHTAGARGRPRTSCSCRRSLKTCATSCARCASSRPGRAHLQSRRVCRGSAPPSQASSRGTPLRKWRPCKWRRTKSRADSPRRGSSTARSGSFLSTCPTSGRRATADAGSRRATPRRARAAEAGTWTSAFACCPRWPSGSCRQRSRSASSWRAAIGTPTCTR
mmetsp:Transcript_113572/g.315987  ORF Transcript_113572/g.315987 Transcript_113572/m.315987 type:complete len:211 (+) Transcript_113572:90-722(+)